MKLGGLDISTVKLGASQVQAIYQGQNLVWQNAPVAIAATGIGATSFTANWEAYTGATYYLLDVSESSDFSTFVYENQRINAPTASYVVIGLQSNTTYYYRVRASDEYDVDAQAFFDRVTTAGGTLSTTEQDAVNTLVVQMKADGIWTKMKAIYPMVGASAAACAQNLKSSSYTGTFTSGWTFASTGVTPNGTSAYMNTNLIPSTTLSLDSVHLSNYFPNFATEDKAQIGSFRSGAEGLYAFYDYTSFGAIIRLNDTANTFVVPMGNDSGFRITTRTSSTTSKTYINNTASYTSSEGSNALPPFSIYIGARNQSNSLSVPSSLEQSFASIGDGLTDTEASDFYTAVQAFNTTLSRQV